MKTERRPNPKKDSFDDYGEGPEIEDVCVDGLTAWLADEGFGIRPAPLIRLADEGLVYPKTLVIRPLPEGEDCLIHQRGQSFLPDKEFCPKAWMMNVLRRLAESFNHTHSAEPGWWLFIDRLFMEKAIGKKAGPVLIIRASFGFQPSGHTWVGRDRCRGGHGGVKGRFPTNLEFGDPDNWKTLADAGLQKTV